MSTGTLLPRKAKLRPPCLKITNLEEIRETNPNSLIYQINTSLFISGYDGAKNYELLRSHQITHVLNLAGDLKCPNKYPSSFNYYSLKMPDNPKTDILFFLYFAIGFIREAVENKGKVLVHCVKGNSRAAAVVIAYFILQGIPETEAFPLTSSCHPNIDPNFGFVCQLKELGRISSEKRFYKYSSKHEMFIGCKDPSGFRIEISGESCVLAGDAETEEEELKALLCVKIWKEITGPIKYCNEF